jgi:hypothetical protein
MESAAVVTRAVVRALLAGEPTGISLAEAMVEPPREPEKAPASPPARSAGRPRELFLGLGFIGGVDGQSPSGQHALALSFGLLLSRFGLRLTLQGGLPAWLSDDATEVTLSRHGVVLTGSVAVLSRERLRLFVSLGAGGYGYYRTTEALAAGYEPTAPQLTLALGLSPSLSLWCRPAPRLPLQLEVFIAAEAVVGRPRLGYSDGGAFVPRSEPWPVLPLLGLSILWSTLTRSGAAPPLSSESAPKKS